LARVGVSTRVDKGFEIREVVANGGQLGAGTFEERLRLKGSERDGVVATLDRRQSHCSGERVARYFWTGAGQNLRECADLCSALVEAGHAYRHQRVRLIAPDPRRNAGRMVRCYPLIHVGVNARQRALRRILHVG
jgi:hypothetical protein